MRCPVLLMAVLALGGMAHGAAPLLSAQTRAAADAAVVLTEFIYETAPFPSAHASTIAEGPSGLVAAWFGGTRERHPDVGIWVARRLEKGWTAPVTANARVIECPTVKAVITQSDRRQSRPR